MRAFRPASARPFGAVLAGAFVAAGLFTPGSFAATAPVSPSAAASASAFPNAAVTGPARGEWNFRVLLDGEPIGWHRFSLRTVDGRRELRSEADFDVRLLGFSAYRYRHRAVERWQGDCLVELDATTDDDGKVTRVQARLDGDALAITAPDGAERLGGCVMSYAYWHPALLARRQLLDPQSGRLEAVRLVQLGSGELPVRGTPTPAERVRLETPRDPIDLWYTASGAWVGLDARVSGGKRMLSYRLE